jgi:hypothetical protein
MRHRRRRGHAHRRRWGRRACRRRRLHLHLRRGSSADVRRRRWRGPHHRRRWRHADRRWWRGRDARHRRWSNRAERCRWCRRWCWGRSRSNHWWHWSGDGGGCHRSARLSQWRGTAGRSGHARRRHGTRYRSRSSDFRPPRDRWRSNLSRCSRRSQSRHPLCRAGTTKRRPCRVRCDDCARRAAWPERCRSGSRSGRRRLAGERTSACGGRNRGLPRIMQWWQRRSGARGRSDGARSQTYRSDGRAGRCRTLTHCTRRRRQVALPSPR